MSTDLPPPVTVGELLDALATYPRDALALTSENGYGGGALYARVGGKLADIWSGVTSEGNWYDPENVPFDDERPKPWEGDR